MPDFDSPDTMSDSQSASSTQTVSTEATSPNLSTFKLNNNSSSNKHQQASTPNRTLLATDKLVITTIPEAPGNASTILDYNDNSNSASTTTDDASTNGSVINEQSTSSAGQNALVTPATPTSATSYVSNKQSASNGNKHDIDEIDGDVKLILGIIESTYQSILSDDQPDQDTITSQFKDIQTALLRLNLHKNLARHQMKAYEEEFQTERQILLKSLQNFEKNLTIIKNENEIINIKNLKLIKYCKTLKNDKIDKLKKENHLLKKRLYDNGIPYSDISPNKSRTRSHSRHTSSIPTPNSPYEQKDGSNGSAQVGGSAPNANLLDTLGRLAAHVLQDEQMNGSFQKKQ